MSWTKIFQLVADDEKIFHFRCECFNVANWIAYLKIKKIGTLFLIKIENILQDKATSINQINFLEFGQICI